MVFSSNEPQNVEFVGGSVHGNHSEWKIGVRFWLKWCLATALGLGLAHVSTGIPLPTTVQHFTFLHVYFGAGVGLAQWLLLRKVIPRAMWWMIASVLSWTMSWPIITLCGGANSCLMWWQGILIGVAALFVIRGRWLQNFLLILAYGIGWLVAFYTAMLLACKAFAVGTSTSTFLPAKSFLQLLVWMAIGTCAGGVLGIITGGPIVWILRQKHQTP